MVRIARPIELPWLHSRFREVPHQLGPGVAIWGIDVPPDAILPPESVGQLELERANRMRDRADSHRFLASHAVLRGTLALALGCSQGRLELIADKLGKPRLKGDPLRFNMSRCGPNVLVGISERHEIGVDIELVRELPNHEDLARAHLSRREYKAWHEGSTVSPEVTFLEFWTRKEACVKAAGIGLALPLWRVDAGCGPEYAPAPVCFQSGLRDWRAQVVSLPMPPGLVAAAAVII